MNHFRLEVTVTVPRKLNETKISDIMILIASVMAEPINMIKFDDPCYDHESAEERVVVTTSEPDEPEKWTRFETDLIIESQLSACHYQELVRKAFYRGAKKLRTSYEIKGSCQKWPPKNICSFKNTSTDLKVFYGKTDKMR